MAGQFSPSPFKDKYLERGFYSKRWDSTPNPSGRKSAALTATPPAAGTDGGNRARGPGREVTVEEGQEGAEDQQQVAEGQEVPAARRDIVAVAGSACILDPLVRDEHVARNRLRHAVQRRAAGVIRALICRFRCVLTCSTFSKTLSRFFPSAICTSSLVQLRLSSSATSAGYLETFSRPSGTLRRAAKGQLK
ncbi:hypothetical protein Z043_122213 [Scleropages formosus]|uniref:Uncharacterized protein n=1 Tax=Scleropages formosus TaxID=113540 RepID=A0A0P7UKH5_SCLFO|nr:hypothetical protein Z043_122213 [Scleropages formosus]